MEKAHRRKLKHDLAPIVFVWAGVSATEAAFPPSILLLFNLGLENSSRA